MSSPLDFLTRGPLGEALRRDRRARFGLAIVALFALMALVGPTLFGDADAPVARPLEPPSAAHWLGTTGQGQDVLAQLVVGARSTLAVGLSVGAAVVAIGALVGVTAGYLGGSADFLLSQLINVLLVLPGLPLAVVVAAYLPSGPATVVAVLTLTGWPWNARVFRAQALALRSRDWVAAAVVSGESHGAIVVRYLLPTMTSLLVTQLIGSTVYAIGAEVGLEFLGIGDVSRVTWGTALYWAANDSALLTGAWWTFVPPGLCIALVAFALVLLSSAFDEATNPGLRTERHWRLALGAHAPPPASPTPVVPHG